MGPFMNKTGQGIDLEIVSTCRISAASLRLPFLACQSSLNNYGHQRDHKFGVELGNIMVDGEAGCGGALNVSHTCILLLEYSSMYNNMTRVPRKHSAARGYCY